MQFKVVSALPVAGHSKKAERHESLVLTNFSTKAPGDDPVEFSHPDPQTDSGAPESISQAPTNAMF
jgi:hypothetical protein